MLNVSHAAGVLQMGAERGRKKGVFVELLHSLSFYLVSTSAPEGSQDGEHRCKHL